MWCIRHMFVEVTDNALMARVGIVEYTGALGKRDVREMDFTGKPMKGYVFVDSAGLESDSDLEHWVSTCLRLVRPLPPKLR